MISKPVKLALIQMSCSTKIEGNLDKAIRLIEEAAQHGAQIVCLQELFKSQYFCQDNNEEHFKLAEMIPGDSVKALSEVAQKNKVVIVASLFEKTAQKKYFNTAVVLDNDGSFLGQYRKNHIPDDPNNFYSEAFYFEKGDLGYKVFDTKVAKISVLVCWDQWFPEAARNCAAQGAEIIFYPTAIGWPRSEREEDIGQTEFDAWQTIQRSHAIANGVFVAACNRVGLEDKLQFWGGSFVSDPFGKVLNKASQNADEIVYATCDLNRISEVRKDWPFLNFRRKDIKID